MGVLPCVEKEVEPARRIYYHILRMFWRECRRLLTVGLNWFRSIRIGLVILQFASKFLQLQLRP
jgi:hypothetical protein